MPFRFNDPTCLSNQLRGLESIPGHAAVNQVNTARSNRQFFKESLSIVLICLVLLINEGLKKQLDALSHWLSVIRFDEAHRLTNSLTKISR